MRRKAPLEISPTWEHPLPMPMKNQPVCVTDEEALAQISRLGVVPRIFLWSDDQRRCPEGWGFLASTRVGVPPEGIEGELGAWLAQYPDAWLAVDLRDGVMPPSTIEPLESLLSSLDRCVLVIVSSASDNEHWPQWVLPF